jgi:hypothetical protein
MGDKNAILGINDKSWNKNGALTTVINTGNFGMCM